jgi:serine protease Do
LIGIATAIIGGAQGIGFAIPIDRAKRIKDDLLTFGEVRAVWVGLRGRTVTSGGDEGKPRGFRVRSVAPESPAAHAGIRAGDLVVSVDGLPIDSEDVWQTALSTKGPGRPMRVVVRTGTGADRSVTLQGEKPPAGLGLRVLREQLGMTVRQTRSGLQITVADRAGLAAKAGLETGDVLLALNNSRVKDTEDVDRVIQRDYNRSTLWLAVGRGRGEYTLTFPLD